MRRERRSDVRENGGTTTRGVTASVGVKRLRMVTSFQKKQVARLNFSGHERT